ncbi:hypothetical protein RCO48_11330 [Peribacillus frigoritolerans]|nr:hypothetical protein [Peribacillus frigoritolerans]
MDKKDKNMVQSKKQRKKKQEIQEQNILLEYKAGSRAAAKKQAINAYKIMPEENEANALPVKVEDKLELASAATSPSKSGEAGCQGIFGHAAGFVK